MFITEERRTGSCYYEFQYCKTNKPMKNNKIDMDILKHWQTDSLLISDKNFDIFFQSYSEILNSALLTNGKTGFDFYGPNYYDKRTAEKILIQIENIIDKKHNYLTEWLQKAFKEFNGFYILGI